MNPPAPSHDAPKQGRQARRDRLSDRLGNALRENLSRRKQQQRARAANPATKPSAATAKTDK
jgi:hypothetical protein